ncbi:MAG: 16S rRNA processing protein RimM [Deltaproteobacteria bacterium]|nr:16S rRNA processing protein RimM [Deltaproteobacteria bacterium]
MNQIDCNSENSSQFVELGKIGRPHGVRGDVRLFLHNPDSDLIFSLDALTLSLPDGRQNECYSIRSVKDGVRFLILSLENIHNREQAQQLNGMVAKIQRNLLPSLDDGEFYVADLIGLNVACNGEPVGVIVDSREQGGIEVITVENEVREIQIPVVDEYVVHRDIPRRIFEVRNIEDLPTHEFVGKGR